MGKLRMSRLTAALLSFLYCIAAATTTPGTMETKVIQDCQKWCADGDRRTEGTCPDCKGKCPECNAGHAQADDTSQQATTNTGAWVMIVVIFSISAILVVCVLVVLLSLCLARKYGEGRVTVLPSSTRSQSQDEQSHLLPQNALPAGGIFSQEIQELQQEMPAYRMPTWPSIVKLLDREPENAQILRTHMSQARILFHSDVEDLISDFISLKRERGSQHEQILFATMRTEEMILRMVSCRPLTFMNASDHYLLRDGHSANGWYVKGTSTEKMDRKLSASQRAFSTRKQDTVLPLTDYMSYDEIAISALMAVGGPTQFLNRGSRSNKGVLAVKDSHVNTGVYVGCVGARFEVAGQMECRFLLVQSDQNTTDNGYGPEAEGPNKELLSIWAKFYGVPHFPLFSTVEAEMAADDNDRYARIDSPRRGLCFLDRVLYRRRIRMSVFPFLRFANDIAKSEGRKAYVHVVGLGLGAWLVHDTQAADQIQVYAQILEEFQFSNISDLDFSWFPATCTSCGSTANGELCNGVRVHFSKRDPAAALTGDDAGKLLVAQYAWDGNALPGNEYWVGLLTASGDPAAAACSTIPFIHNPDINTFTADQIIFYDNPVNS